MKKTILAITLVSTLGSVSLFSKIHIKPTHRNMQTGCGLGNKVIKRPDSAIMYALQATTNGTSGNQTFGISSGTSGCKKVSFVMNDRAQEFVASNMDALAKDISKGQGESLSTLAELLNIEDKASFFVALQSNYNSIYANAQVEMADVLDGVSASI